jgi:hypothetical protein
MTGYEDLDQNGVWRDDAEYGPLWIPRAVPADWAPYRDGSWTWIAPWGWTWVDNAPWGYAPFHYGRWVHVNQRWAWAPGRQVSRPVWAPALVGWVGGSGWSLNFNSGGGHRPAQGWYPLTPRDAFVPGYRLSHDHLQRINRDARPDGRGDWRGRDFHHEGLTVVPHEQFGRPGTFSLRNLPRAAVSPLAIQTAPAAVPVAPKGREQDGRGGDRFDRGARMDRDELQRNRPHRPELSGVSPRVQVQPALPGQPAPSPFSRRDGRPGFDDRDRGQRPPLAPASATAAQSTQPPPAAQPNYGRRDDRRDFEERRQFQQPRQSIPPFLAAPQLPQAPMAAMPPAAAPMQQTPPPAADQRGRPVRGDPEHRLREPDISQSQVQQRQFSAPPAFQQPAPAPMPQPARQAAPQQPAPPAVAASAPAPERRGNHRVDERKRGDGEKER